MVEILIPIYVTRKCCSCFQSLYVTRDYKERLTCIHCYEDLIFDPKTNQLTKAYASNSVQKN